ncbi:MAG: alpha-glucan family phosphorylase, partial [Pseudomonadales bacterium]|nr:alpha-glucan family phosphorylase [Pseudomonadales bacterium]
FDHELIRHYFSEYVNELKVPMDRFLALGASPANAHGFNMTALALRGSRFHNGVSRIHGTVASDMESYVWPEIPNPENPIRYVTNGVHVPTFLASEWANHFDLTFGGRWRFELLNNEYWRQIHNIPNHSFWSIRKSLKTKMLETVVEKAVVQYRRNGFSESQIKRMTRFLNPRLTDVLTIGFARRFATYKRATLVFSDIERIRKLLTNKDRPVVLIFAGKAHPHDQPGQDLIRKIWQLSLMPEFQGKIILLENFDIALARKLVTGVDVWLNNPAYPLEASGTSGQKAGINGVLNLSVLDGWWDEGYNGENGWAITPHGEQYSPEFRDKEEARELLDVLEYEAIPLYYQRDGQGYSAGWIDKCKHAMASLIPQFNAQRMLSDYVRDFYANAAKLGRHLQSNNNQLSHELSEWKQKVQELWHKVSVERLDEPVSKIYRDQAFEVRLAIDLAGLAPDDIAVDLLIGRVSFDGDFDRHSCASLHYIEMLPDGRALFTISMALAESGKQSYMLRMYPYNELLGQRFEMGFMKWL